MLTPAALVATWVALGDVPLMAIDGGTHLQIEACRLIAVAVVAAGLMFRRVHARKTKEATTET